MVFDCIPAYTNAVDGEEPHKAFAENGVIVKVDELPVGAKKLLAD